MREIHFVLDDLLGGDGFKDVLLSPRKIWGKDEPIFHSYYCSDGLKRTNHPTSLGMLGFSTSPLPLQELQQCEVGYVPFRQVTGGNGPGLGDTWLITMVFVSK